MNIKAVRLPQNLCKMLLECSSKDETRGILYRTFTIEQEGGDFVLVATDTHRMVTVRFTGDEFKSTLLPESGTWRWVTIKPSKHINDLVLIEEFDGDKYPNWRRIHDQFSAMARVGAIYYNSNGHFGSPHTLQCSVPISINPLLLPPLKSEWEGDALMICGEKTANRYRLQTSSGGTCRIFGDSEITMTFDVDYILIGTAFQITISEEIECPIFDRAQAKLMEASK